MLRKLFTTLSIIACTSGALMQAQNESAIKVKLIDKANKETIPFANVVVEMGGMQVGIGTTNIDGEVTIKPLNPGKYNVKGVFVGYQTVQIENVAVTVGKTVHLNIEMTAGIQLEVMEKVEYTVPLIDPDTKSGKTVDRETYVNMASKNINSVAATTAGIYQGDEGNALSVRGARSNGTAYYVDGMKVIGSQGVSQASIEQITTIVGGTPAEFGDATGGIVSVTTRGPASKYGGSVQLITSGAGEKKGLDSYGYNLIGFSASGPIKTTKDSTGVKKSVLGFFVGGEVSSVQDADPSANGIYRLNADKLAYLEENPIRPSSKGASGYLLNSEFVTASDLEKVKAKQNVGAKALLLNGRLTYQPTSNMTIILGGGVTYNKSHLYNFGNSIFNTVNNAENKNNTWRGFAKIVQKFNSATTKEEEKSSSIIKNAFFTLMVNYEKQNIVQQDDSHQDNLFDYGYIGKFNQTRENSYTLETRDKYDVDGDGVKDTVTAFFHDGFNDLNLSFTPSDKNPTGTNYTKQFYRFAGSAKNLNDVRKAQGLMNGDQPNSVYSLWNNTGFQYNGYEKFQQSQFRVVANFAADIKNHEIKVGFEYEQRTERDFFINPVGLWERMRALTNSHLTTQLDTTPILNPGKQLSTGFPFPYYDFNRKNDGTQTEFDRNIRKKLGYDVNGTDMIDIDSYDPSTFSLDMFSADDLYNLTGTSLINYYGYDHTGKKLTGKPSVDDFFTKKDANGNFTRQIGAYQPIYISGYIQDKFDFKDLKFNVGLRIDRFDANQPVLKDKYLLYETKTASEVNYSQFNTTRPSNIGDDYSVYVDNKDNPTKIVGYRKEDVWYNSLGKEVDPSSLTGSNTADGRINPYLVDPASAKTKTISPKVFEDYTPQINFMPRIAFAFPISDQANFFAHYDVLTQRPPNGNRMDPDQFLSIEDNPGVVLNNANLKPEKTVDYELGFTQVLNEKQNSALTLSTFYREQRDMLQVTNVYLAYPISYYTYDNIDFGTAKGFSIAYDLRRSNGVQLNANYTLQFANATGSSTFDNSSLAASGKGNIRTAHATNTDQRHSIVLNVDYRFFGGKDYKGPKLTLKKGGDKEKTINVLENVGANATLFAGSGTPYSKQSNVTPTVQGGVNNAAILKGENNGSYLPWNYRMDLRVDKRIALTYGGKNEGDAKKHASLNVFITVLNLLATKNIQGVYRYTGNPDDDGYLASADAQPTINSKTDPTAFRDQYRVRVNNPNNYSRARVIRLGLELTF